MTNKQLAMVSQDGASIGIRIVQNSDGSYSVSTADQAAITDSSGTAFEPSNMVQSMTYNSDGTLATITATGSNGTWVQTLTYTNGLLTGISQWVKQ